MHDILIHEYFGVDLELTWKVAKHRNHQPKKENTQNNGRFEEKIDG
jgi:uncharacterized protein with HEPN domain